MDEESEAASITDRQNEEFIGDIQEITKPTDKDND